MALLKLNLVRLFWLDVVFFQVQLPYQVEELSVDKGLLIP